MTYLRENLRHAPSGTAVAKSVLALYGIALIAHNIIGINLI